MVDEIFVIMQNKINLKAFTHAEVLIAKRERGKMNLLNLSRTRELKEPSSRFMKQCAFTLAEVLITLGIIGVVAALTIPVLMNTYQETQYKIAYRKAYAEACGAIGKLMSQNSLEPVCTTFTGGLCDGSTNINNFNAFKNEFIITKDCSNNNNSECWNPKGEVYQVIWPTNAQKAFIDNSGKSWTMISDLHFIAVDTNGFKPPNKYGKDRFPFAWSNSGTTWHSVQNLISPTVFGVFDDATSVTVSCSSGNCLYRTWLRN